MNWVAEIGERKNYNSVNWVAKIGGGNKKKKGNCGNCVAEIGEREKKIKRAKVLKIGEKR